MFRERFWVSQSSAINNVEFTVLFRSKPTRGDAVTITIPEDSVYVIPAAELNGAP